MWLRNKDQRQLLSGYARYLRKPGEERFPNWELAKLISPCSGYDVTIRSYEDFAHIHDAKLAEPETDEAVIAAIPVVIAANRRIKDANNLLAMRGLIQWQPCDDDTVMVTLTREGYELGETFSDFWSRLRLNPWLWPIIVGIGSAVGGIVTASAKGWLGG